MRKIRVISSIATVLAAACMLPCMNTYAATEADVIEAVRANGWPDWMVQTVSNSISGGGFTSDQYDKMIAQIGAYDAEIEKQVAEQLGITLPEKEEAPTESTGSTSGSTSGNTGGSSGNKTFADMTLEEKKAYLNSMTEAEQQEFLSSLSAEDRNSLIKQMGLSQKAELVAGFKDILSEFGITVSIEELTDENISISTLDENGNILGISSMSMKVDPTGSSRALPIIGGTGLLLVSAAGTVFLLRGKSEKKDFS